MIFCFFIANFQGQKQEMKNKNFFTLKIKKYVRESGERLK